jgi:hypothetical protein
MRFRYRAPRACNCVRRCGGADENHCRRRKAEGVSRCGEGQRVAAGGGRRAATRQRGSAGWMRAAAAYPNGRCEPRRSLPSFGCELCPAPSACFATSRSGLLWPATTTTSSGGSQEESTGAREATTGDGWGRGTSCCWIQRHCSPLSPSLSWGFLQMWFG